MNGFFVISLDFELYWGVSESKDIKSYFYNLNNTKHVVNKLLNIFLKNQNNIPNLQYATTCIIIFLKASNNE